VNLRNVRLLCFFPALGLGLLARAQTTVEVDANGVLSSPTDFVSRNAATAAQVRAGTEAEKFLTPLRLSELIEARDGAGLAAGGKIFLNAGTGATVADVAASAGEIDLSGGAGAATPGGSILLFGGAGDQAAGGSILLRGGTATGTRGGLLYAVGGNTTNARGGDLLTYGVTAPGGDIITFDGGGSLNTRTGTLELGITGARTTVTKSPAATANTLTLPTESGVLATRSWVGARNVPLGGGTAQDALEALDTVTASTGTVYTVNVNGRQRVFELRAETANDTPNGVTLIRPTDYDSVTNKVVLSDITNDGGRVDVRVFGAVGDGVADDRAAIQAAIDHAASVGLEVYIPPGTYYVTPDPLTNVGLSIPSNLTVRGAGWSSIIRFPGVGLAPCIGNAASHGTQEQQDQGDVNIHIHDLKLDLEGTGNNGVVFGGVVGGSIVNVWVENAFGYAIHLVRNNDTPTTLGKATEQILVRGCRVTNIRDVGIELSGANNCTVMNNFASGAGAVGVLGAGYECWNGSRNNVFSGNVAVGTGSPNLFTAFRIDPQPGDASPMVPDTAHNIFIGNVARNVQIGFKCHSDLGGKVIRKNTFKGNQVEAAPGISTIGIWLVNAEDMVISDNVFTGFTDPFEHSTPLLAGSAFTNTGTLIQGNVWRDSGNALNLYGLTAGAFERNSILRTSNGRAVNLVATRYSSIKDNTAWNLGTSAASPFLVLTAEAGVESSNNVVEGNSVIDSRSGSERRSFYAVGLGDASSANIVRDNIALNTPQNLSIIVNAASNLIDGNVPTAQGYSNGQLIHSSVAASASAAGGAETFLRQVGLQDRALRKDGDLLDIVATFTFAANTNLKRVRLYFSGATVYDSDQKRESGTTLVVRARIVRSGASAQIVAVSVDGSATLVERGGVSFGSVNMEATTFVRATGQGTAFQDVVLRSLTISYQSAP